MATPERIPWCQELRDRFSARFLLVKIHNDQNNPDLPFHYLAGDGFSQAFEVDGTTPIPRQILVSFIDAAHLIPFSESQNDHSTNGFALFRRIDAHRDAATCVLSPLKKFVRFYSVANIEVRSLCRISPLSPLSNLP